MAILTKARGSQYPLTAVFEFTITDQMIGPTGFTKTFNETSTILDVINLPQGAIVVGGDMTVLTVSNDSGTATLAIGDPTTPTRYLSATNIKALARTALTITGYEGATGENIRITLANQNGDATTGKVRITVSYIVKNRVNEVQTH